MSAPPEARALARAVVSAVEDRSGALQEGLSCFPAASSFRVALPLGSGSGAVLVTSDLRRQGATTFWATSDASLVSRTLRHCRTAAVEGAGIHALADLHQLHGQEGAASFVCVPVCAEPGLVTPRPAVAALLLAWPSSAAAPQEELRLALLLAGELSRAHSKDLHTFAARMYTALHPSEHAAWGPGVSPEYPELSGSEDESDAEGEGGSSSDHSSSAGPSTSSSLAALLGAAGAGAATAASRPQRPPPARWCMDPRTLRFADRKLERRFQLWRNRRLAKVDTTALLSLLVYHGASCFLPPFASCRPSVLPALTVLIPLLLLLLLNHSHSWYIKHRDQLLMCTYVLLACHQALDMAQAAAAPEGLWRSVFLRSEAAWCVVMGVILQVQFVGQCLMLAGGAALKALLQPGCAARLSSEHAAAAAAGQPQCLQPAATDDCFLDGITRALLIKVALPCGLAYYVELLARRTFCRSVVRSAGAP